jgi:hypothetical protein
MRILTNAVQEDFLKVLMNFVLRKEGEQRAKTESCMCSSAPKRW